MNDISFNLVGFFRLLVYVRILNPASKIQTIRNNSEYYDEILSYSYVFNVYDTLDFMYKYKNNLINKMHKSLVSSFNRTTSCIYYDCTNFFFETERPDDDVCDEERNIIKKGIRKCRFLEQISFILRPLLCIKMLVIRCLCAIALIQNDTPTSKMTPLLEKRNHIEFTCSLKLDKNIIVKTVIDLNFNRTKYESINYSSLLFGDKLFIILSMHFFLLSSFGCTYKFNVIEILL